MRVSSSSILLALAASTATITHGFTVTPNAHTATRHLVRTFMSDDDISPSDMDNSNVFDDGVVTVESETFEPTQGEALVTSVMDQLPGVGEVSAETRAAINEALLKLESLNPTTDPANSPLVNGVWELRYAGGYAAEGALQSPTRQLALFLYSGGYSPGLFALSLAKKLPTAFIELGDLEISISRDQPRVEATIPLKLFGSTDNKVSVKARMEVMSGVRLSETYESATVMDRTIEIPEKVRYSRDMYVTYVDSDLLVIRDGSGVPEVLVRKDKTFVENWGTEPGDVDDMVAPGE